MLELNCEGYVDVGGMGQLEEKRTVDKRPFGRRKQDTERRPVSLEQKQSERVGRVW